MAITPKPKIDVNPATMSNDFEVTLLENTIANTIAMQ